MNRLLLATLTIGLSISPSIAAEWGMDPSIKDLQPDNQLLRDQPLLSDPGREYRNDDPILRSDPNLLNPPPDRNTNNEDDVDSCYSMACQKAY
jgi:hypothetical protein